MSALNSALNSSFLLSLIQSVSSSSSPSNQVHPSIRLTMESHYRSSSSNGKAKSSRPIRDALEPVMSTGSAYLSGVGQTLAIGREVVSLPFRSEMKRSESIRMINNRESLEASAFCITNADLGLRKQLAVSRDK